MTRHRRLRRRQGGLGPGATPGISGRRSRLLQGASIRLGGDLGLRRGRIDPTGLQGGRLCRTPTVTITSEVFVETKVR